MCVFRVVLLDPGLCLSYDVVVEIATPLMLSFLAGCAVQSCRERGCGVQIAPGSVVSILAQIIPIYIELWELSVYTCCLRDESCVNSCWILLLVCVERLRVSIRVFAHP